MINEGPKHITNLIIDVGYFGRWKNWGFLSKMTLPVLNNTLNIAYKTSQFHFSHSKTSKKAYPENTTSLCLALSNGGERLPRLGICPHCEQQLVDDDVEIIQFKGIIGRHFAHRCRKCDKIIGFSSFFNS